MAAVGRVGKLWYPDSRMVVWQKIRRELGQGRTLIAFTSLQAVALGVGILVPLIVAKVFSADAFGRFALAKMIVFFFTSLLISSGQAPFIVFANQEKTRTGKINKAFTTQCVFLVATFCLLLCIILPLSKYIMAFAKISAWDLLFVLLAFVGVAINTFVCNLFMALNQRIKKSAVELVFGSLTLGFILVFYLTQRTNLRTVFFAYFLSALPVLVISLMSIDFNQILPFAFDRQCLRDTFNFSKWIVLGGMAIYFVNWGDNLVLRLFTSMAEIGTYNLAYQIFKGVVMLSLTLNSYFLPFVSRHVGDSTKMKNYLFKKRPRIFLIGLICIGLIFLLAPQILNLFGPDYRNSVGVLRILLVGSLAMLYTVFYIPVLNCLKRYRFHQTVNVFQVLLNVALDILLVPIIGALGAAVATTIGYFCQAVVFEIYFRVRLRKLLWE